MSAEGEGGGGHGGWIVTYSDMITLLMTLFIVIVTFGSKEQDRNGHKKRDSVVGGQGGTGAAGGKSSSNDKTAVMVRVSQLGQTVFHGSEAAPMYSDTSSEPLEAVMKGLDFKPDGSLADNYRLRLPTSFLFKDNLQLSDSGMYALQSLANTVRPLPCDLQLLVDDPARLNQAARVSQYLFQITKIFPGRVSIAVTPDKDPGPDEAVWIAVYQSR